ncbi:MAG: hypothetical protein FD135_5354, partial [Comamonadaceae bacterium]
RVNQHFGKFPEIDPRGDIHRKLRGESGKCA